MSTSFDLHAPRIYALLLRMLPPEMAETALIEVFGDAPEAPLPDLVAAAHKKALKRLNRSPAPFVEIPSEAATPRKLLEEVFFLGRSVANLAAATGLDEETIRCRLRDGMTEIQRKVSRNRND